MQDQGLVLNESANGGRLFEADRRLQPHPNQVLKCPRCDSLNTKFCYFNNYNLSQPRHFCKSCRRYWTRGGVLRNVPVGGGCRKPKRSNPKSASTSSDEHQKRPKLNISSHSSSDSSSLTAPTTCSTSLSPLLSFPKLESSFNLDQCSDNCGSFTGMMNAVTEYNFTEIYPFRLNHQRQQHENELQQQEKTSAAEVMKMQELTAGCNIDQTVGIDPSELENGKGGGELTALDWQSSQGLFDLTHGYWNQSQWTDPHHHIYLP